MKANEKKNAKSLTFFTSPPFIFQLALKLNVLFSESVSKPGNEEAAAKVGKTGGKKLLFDTISQKFQNSELSVTAPLLITISFDTGAIMTKTTTLKNVYMSISAFGGLQSTIIC